MSFSILDFIIGILLMGSIVHIVMAHTDRKFPSLFGHSAKANLIYGLMIAFIAVDLYIYKYGLNATINNSLLLGMIDMLILWAAFGRLLFRHTEKKSV